MAAAQGRTPLDLLSAALKGYLEPGAPGDVYAYGNGANYQLGTGGTGLQVRRTRPGPDLFTPSRPLLDMGPHAVVTDAGSRAACRVRSFMRPPGTVPDLLFNSLTSGLF